MKFDDILKIVAILKTTYIYIKGNLVFADQFVLKSDFNSKKCLKFSDSQFRLLTEDTTFKETSAFVKTKNSIMEITAEESDKEIPEFKGKEVKFDNSALKGFNEETSEFFIMKELMAFPTNQKIFYTKAKNDFECVVSGYFVTLLNHTKFTKLLQSENSLIVCMKDGKIEFPFLSVDISINNVRSIIKSSQNIGKIILSEEVLKDLAKIPVKEELVEFANDKIKVDTAILKFSGKTKASGNVNAKVQLCNLKMNQKEIFVCNNCLKYKLGDVYLLIPFVG